MASITTSPNVIVATGEPRGLFQEGVLATAGAKPGQCIKLESVTGVSTDPFHSGGTVREYTLEPGCAAEICVLTEMNLIGKTIHDPYAVGDGIHYYIPLPGEPFYALALSGAVLNVGVRAVFDANGKLIAGATGNIIVMDDAGTLDADTLVLCRLGVSNAATV